MLEPKMLAPIIIFAGTFLLIMTEKVHRTIAALTGAVIMIVVGSWMGFYDDKMAFHAIDFNTIGLLLGMMLIIAMMEETGLFEYAAIKAARVSRGNPIVLLISLGATTSVLSMFLDNVTTVVLIAPVTILITRLLGLNPVPFLIAEAILSNTGGMATLVGDPPNIMIGSVTELSFNDFIINLGPHALVAWFIALGLLILIFKRHLNKKPKGLDSLMQIDASSSLKNKKNAHKLLWILGLVVLLFFLHDLLHLSPSVVALFGATLGFLWVRPDLDETLKRIELSVLLFFAALFIAVGGLEHSGVLEIMAESIVPLAGKNLLLCCIVLLWVSAIASAIVDNIPFTMAMIPVIQYLETQGIMVTPLWWALALGVGLGGNGTPIGSTANVVVVSLSEKTNTPITSKIWLKTGLPIMFATCAIITLTFIVYFKLMNY